jgi:acetyl esterase/lipase
MGFSAGGHLASTAGTHFNKSFIPNEKNVSLRPDFMILIYPVISFQDSITHMGSRIQLLGRHPTTEQINYFSNELQVTKETPPTFLVHASDDDLVKVENSVVFYQNLIKNKVPAELHVYEKGGHGFGLTNRTTSDSWMERCKNWMIGNGWLK